MSKRITLISFMENSEIGKVEKLMNNIKENTCKVPYGINDNKRYEIDNLPYHFTIFATDKENQNKILEIAKNISVEKILLKVNDIKIMDTKYNSYCLYLSIEEKYNPDDFIFHITLHIDKDYNKILNFQRILKRHFKPFYLEFNTLALYDYPGEIIEKINI